MPQLRRPLRRLRMGRKLLTMSFTPSASPRQVLIGSPILPTLRVRLAFTGPRFSFSNTSALGYMKNVKAHLANTGASPEEIEKFQAGAKKFVGTYCSQKYFPKWEFYIGETMDVDGMYVFLPLFYYQLLTHLPCRKIGLFSLTTGMTAKLHTWFSGNMVSKKKRFKL